MIKTALPAVLASLVAAVGSACGEAPQSHDRGSRVARRPANDDSAATGATRARACRVTSPNHDVPPGQEDTPGAEQATYYGNGRLWTVLEQDGVVRDVPRRDGSIRRKFPWWRGVPGTLRIAGRRLDGSASPLRARVPEGYGSTGFQSSGIIFPGAGCWRVTGAAGGATLSFVTLVVKAPR